MHVLETTLRSIVEKVTDVSPEVLRHLKTCEMCQERLEDLRLHKEALSEVSADSISAAAAKAADRLFEAARSGLVIRVAPLPMESSEALPSLAADGKPRPKSGHRNLATLYSESPEVVLRVMHDEGANQSYLQLLCEDPSLISNVMVEIPEVELEVVTDASGRADLTTTPDLASKDLAWQIRLPNAEFKLEPLSFDPDRTEYSEEVILNTDRKDRVKVTFEGKADGKQLLIQILELGGNADFKPVTLVVSQDQDISILGALPGQAARWSMMDSSSEIRIRLFG